jgi:DNA-binding transcriptional regulator YdaS (Cro superfamily)
MTLQEYFLDKPRGAKAEMANNLGISRTWLSLLIAGSVAPSGSLCVAIEKLTKKKVKRSELRYDLFGE